MEEKDAGEDGGAGGDVPHVQDRVDEGHTAQLPVVAGDEASFHSISISKKIPFGIITKIKDRTPLPPPLAFFPQKIHMKIHSGEKSPEVGGAK